MNRMNQNLPRQQSVSKPNAYSPSSSSTIHCRLPSPVSASAGLSARPDRVTQPLSFQNPNPWLPCPYQAVVVLPILGYLEIPQVIHLSAETMSHCSHCVATTLLSCGAQVPYLCWNGDFAFWSTENVQVADVVLC